MLPPWSQLTRANSVETLKEKTEYEKRSGTMIMAISVLGSHVDATVPSGAVKYNQEVVDETVCSLPPEEQPKTSHSPVH